MSKKSASPSRPKASDGSMRRRPGSPPASGPPTSLWNLLSACTEFQPGAQKRDWGAKDS